MKRRTVALPRTWRCRPPRRAGPACSPQKQPGPRCWQCQGSGASPALSPRLPCCGAPRPSWCRAPAGAQGHRAGRRAVGNVEPGLGGHVGTHGVGRREEHAALTRRRKLRGIHGALTSVGVWRDDTPKSFQRHVPASTTCSDPSNTVPTVATKPASGTAAADCGGARLAVAAVGVGAARKGLAGLEDAWLERRCLSEERTGCRERDRDLGPRGGGDGGDLGFIHSSAGPGGPVICRDRSILETADCPVPRRGSVVYYYYRPWPLDRLDTQVSSP